MKKILRIPWKLHVCEFLENKHFWGHFWATWLWFWVNNCPPNLWISLPDVLKWCHSLCDDLKISFNEIHRLGTNLCTQNHYRLTQKWSQNWLYSKTPKYAFLGTLLWFSSHNFAHYVWISFINVLKCSLRLALTNKISLKRK